MPPGAVAPRGLPRSRRIKQARDFGRARVQGKRTVEGCLILNWLSLPAATGSRVGVIVSRKVGEAVARTRARRLMRETFRLHQQELAEPLDLVMIARPSIVGRKLGAVESDFLKALRRARLLKPHTSGEATPVQATNS